MSTTRAPSMVSLSFVAAAVLLSGCMEQAGAERVYSELAARDAEHHAAAANASSVSDLRAETERYAAEMPSIVDDMMATCLDMMGSGMMGAGDMDGMDALGGQMKAAVGAHRARMGAMIDLATMRAECETHHAAMVSMLGDMSTMLRHGAEMH